MSVTVSSHGYPPALFPFRWKIRAKNMVWELEGPPDHLANSHLLQNGKWGLMPREGKGPI